MTKELLFYTDDIEGASEEIEENDGRIVHRFTAHAFVAQIPDSLDIGKLRLSQLAPTKELNLTEEIAVNAWRLSLEKREAEALSARRLLSWDHPEFDSPDYVNEVSEEE